MINNKFFIVMGIGTDNPYKKYVNGIFYDNNKSMFYYHFKDTNSWQLIDYKTGAYIIGKRTKKELFEAITPQLLEAVEKVRKTDRYKNLLIDPLKPYKKEESKAQIKKPILNSATLKQLNYLTYLGATEQQKENLTVKTASILINKLLKIKRDLNKNKLNNNINNRYFTITNNEKDTYKWSF